MLAIHNRVRLGELERISVVMLGFYFVFARVAVILYFLLDTIRRYCEEGKHRERDDNLQFVPLTIRKDCTHLGVTASKIDNICVRIQVYTGSDEQLIKSDCMKLKVYLN